MENESVEIKLLRRKKTQYYSNYYRNNPDNIIMILVTSQYGFSSTTDISWHSSLTLLAFLTDILAFDTDNLCCISSGQRY